MVPGDGPGGSLVRPELLVKCLHCPAMASMYVSVSFSTWYRQFEQGLWGSSVKRIRLKIDDCLRFKTSLNLSSKFAQHDDFL